MVAQSASGWSTAVLLAEPKANTHLVQASAMALTVGGRARVVVADTVRSAAGWRWSIQLFRER